MLPSLLRTVVPLLVGWLAALGVQLDSASLTAGVTALVSAVYYTVLRLVETWACQLDKGWLKTTAGILLGWADQPEYHHGNGTTTKTPQ